MKITLVLAIFLLSAQAMAHQYIQCHNDNSQAWTRVIISLDKPDQLETRTIGTLYLHEDFGQNTNISRPFVIKIDRNNRDIISYKGFTQRGKHEVMIPTNLIGKSFRSETIRIKSTLENRNFWILEDYICFSNIYNE